MIPSLEGGRQPTPAGRGLTWRRLLSIAGLLATVAMAVTALAISDLEGGIVATGFGIATFLTRGSRKRLGAVGIGLASAITLFFMLTAAVTNARAGSELSAVLISATLAAVALLGLIAAIGCLVNGSSDSIAGPWAAVTGSGLVLIALVLWGTSSASAATPAADVYLTTEHVAFSQNEIRVPAGEVTVVVENKDLFWHTFTIPELGVNLRVPVGAKLPVSFDAPVGEYQFICAIPGHFEAGMHGTLVVEP